MKKTITILTLLLTVILVFSVLPLTASAQTVTRIDEFRFAANYSAIALTNKVTVGTWLNSLKNANNGVGKGVMAAADTEGWKVDGIVGAYDLTLGRYLNSSEYPDLSHDNWLRVKVAITDADNYVFNGNKSHSFPIYVNGRYAGAAPLDVYGNAEFALTTQKYLTGAAFTVPEPKLNGLCSDYVPTLTAPNNQADYMHYTYNWKRYKTNNPGLVIECTSFSDSSYLYRLTIDLTCDDDYDMPLVNEGFVLTLNGMDMKKHSFYYHEGHIQIMYDFTLSASSTLVGDVNGDGVVNGADSGILKRCTAGWSGYASNIKNMDAADINRDGSVNGADSGLLKRYTAGWSGYDKYIITVSG